MAPSRQHSLDKNRKPRVHITYDVETNGAIEKKELPFVMGIMGDFSGNAGVRVDYEKRKPISLDRDNFSTIMKSICPTISVTYTDRLSGGDPKEMTQNISFESMKDFEPAQIVQKVSALKIIKESRDKLQALLNIADRSSDVTADLEAILKDTSRVSQAARELDISSNSTEGSGDPK